MIYKEQKKIAVLLTAYNGEKYIEQQISSILNQEEVELKIFLSIDISHDQTKKICENINSNKIEILPYGEHFASAGRNFYRLFKDVDFKNFDFIALSDQDDIWKNNKISRAIQILNRTQSAGYSSDVLAFWENRKNKYIRKSYPQKKYDFIFESAGPGCTFVLTKKLASEIKNKILNTSPQSLPYHHDWFIYAYARSKNFTWFIDEFPSVLYRQHQNNQIGANSGYIQNIKRIKMLLNRNYKNNIIQIMESINAKNNNYRMKIIKNPFQCRRNPLEAFFLLIITLIGII